MSTVRRPRVYIEEVPSASKPIEGVGTSIAAFVGFAPGGPVSRPLRISSWTQFAKIYSGVQQPEAGPFMPGAYLAHAVRGFFENGGRVCWTVRAGRRGKPGRPDAIPPGGIEQADSERAAALREGIGSLAAIDEITMISVPDLMTLAPGKGDAPPRDLQTALIGHCEKNGARIAILDPPPDVQPKDIVQWRRNVAGHDSASATLYYPWIEVVDPLSNRPSAVPPSGLVAGVWARTASAGGIHRAPTDAAVLGASGLAHEISEDEQRVLAEAGVNSIRSFPGRGIRIWGARTLSSDPEWRYLSVRRLFIYVSESITKATRWAAFEANDEQLWTQLRSSICNFLTRAWCEGALVGSSPEQAFYVKCDAETNPPDVIEAGQVVIEIGIRPAKPEDAVEAEAAHAADFVVFRISQPTAAASEVDAHPNG
jgi:phage tail sheath protein FI